MLEMRIRLPFVLLALAVLLVGHQLVYTATYGWRGVERALSSVGHDTYWLVFGGAVSVALLLGLAVSLRRWVALRTELRRRSSVRPHAAVDGGRVRATVLNLAPRLALVAVALFFAQENLEHYILHGGHVPGFGVLLGPEYVATLPIFLAVSGVVSLVAIILRLGLAALERLVDRTGRRRPERDLRRPAGRLLPVHSCLRGTPDLGRAPPAPA